MGTELFGANMVDTMANTGKALITSPVVQSVISSLITTVFVRRGENTKLVAALKTKKFENVIEELLKTGGPSYVELYKCKNFLEIAKRADEMMAVRCMDNKESVQDKCNEQGEFSFDWLMRFFDAVGNISNEDLQNLWGKVLAGEIVRPNTCSLRTLDMIRNMSPGEAKIFSVLSRYVMQSGNTYYIDSAGFFCAEDGHQKCRAYIHNKGLSYEEHIVPLLEAGAFTQDHDLALYINHETSLEIHNDKICGIIMYHADEPVLFRRDAYMLTASGRELFSVIRQSDDFEADEDYALLCLKDMKEMNPAFYVGAFKVSEGGSNVDLLEE